jgi:dihydroorotase
MASRTVIKGAQLIGEGLIRHADLAMEGGHISEISAHVEPRPGDLEVAADGLLCIPGLIDDQVHLREPGSGRAGDLASESRAAVAGGITSVLDMPNTHPATTSAALLREKFERAKGRVHTNYSFYLGATNENLAEVEGAARAGACGVKVFMGASTGELLVDDRDALEAIFARSPLLVATHCEDSPLIDENLAAMARLHGEHIPMDAHPLIRSEEACYRSSSLAVAIAKKHGTRLHVLHLSTARELELFQPGPLEDKRITAEACVHHLFFDDRDYARLGARIKWNPAIKSRADRAALLAAVADDRIDVIATDHAPHPLEDKQRPYARCPSGAPLVQHALPALLALCSEGALSVQSVVDKMCHAPAVLFGLEGRGYLREGYAADVVLLDLRSSWTVTPESLLYGCGWSPFEGHRFGARVHSVWVNGVRRVAESELLGEASGQPLAVRRGRT